MTVSEDQLVRWTYPASDTEEQKCERATGMIRKALEACPKLKQREWDIIPQGSYHNNTNARTSSDVDVAVVFDDTVYTDFTYAEGENSTTAGYTDANRPLADARALVLAALRTHFGASQVTDGNKAIQIKSNTARVEADVVVAYEFRGHRPKVNGVTQYRKGLKFFAKDGKPVINFPEQHHKRGKDKNVATVNRYKHVTRILKHARYTMLDAKVPEADGVSSFLIECAVHNISDDVFGSSNTWRGRTQNVLYAMHQALKSGEAAKKWTEVSGEKWLFLDTYGIPANWTPQQLQAFVLAAYKYIID